MQKDIAIHLDSYLENHVSEGARERMLAHLLELEAEDPDLFDGSHGWDSVIGIASNRAGVNLWANVEPSIAAILDRAGMR